MEGGTVLITTDDGSLPVQTEEEARQMMEERQTFEIDRYYDMLRDHTFATRFVPVSVLQAQAWRKYNRGGAPVIIEYILIAFLTSYYWQRRFYTFFSAAER